MDIQQYQQELKFVLDSYLFSGFTEDEKKAILSVSYFRQAQPGDIITHEGLRENTVYFVVSGKVEIFKKDLKTQSGHKIACLSSGEYFGEMEFVENSVRSATAISKEQSTLFAIDVKPLSTLTEYAHIKNRVIAKLSIILADRLKVADNIVIDQLENKLKLTKFQLDNGQLMLAFLVATAIYGLSFSTVISYQKIFGNDIPSYVFSSMAVFFVYFLAIVIIVLRSGRNLDFFGITFDNTAKTIKSAVLYSLPVIALVVIIKYFIIKFVPTFQNLSLFNIGIDISKPGSVFPVIYIFYILLCPIEEFIIRGCLQSTVKSFLSGAEFKRKWLSIIFSNTVFASMNAHFSLEFSLMVFCAGLFWGWLYDKKKNLFFVSVSHILIGVWALFVVGIQLVV